MADVESSAKTPVNTADRIRFFRDISPPLVKSASWVKANSDHHPGYSTRYNGEL